MRVNSEVLLQQIRDIKTRNQYIIEFVRNIPGDFIDFQMLEGVSAGQPTLADLVGVFNDHIKDVIVQVCEAHISNFLIQYEGICFKLLDNNIFNRKGVPLAYLKLLDAFLYRNDAVAASMRKMDWEFRKDRALNHFTDFVKALQKNQIKLDQKQFETV